VVEALVTPGKFLKRGLGWPIRATIGATLTSACKVEPEALRNPCTVAGIPDAYYSSSQGSPVAKRPKTHWQKLN
jgi:hypothetical protein